MKEPQEKLAALIGEEAFYIDGPYDDEVNRRPARKRMCNIDELIEIAEGRLFDADCAIDISREPGCDWECAWTQAFDPWEIIAQVFAGTKQEAEMACAIAGLKRLQQEKEKEDGLR